VVDDQTIAFGEIRSPGTIRNLRTNSRIEINFVDPFVRKGYRFAGTAIVVERGTDTFDTLVGRLPGRARAEYTRYCGDHSEQGTSPYIAGL
jgi:hypothetical protein